MVSPFFLWEDCIVRWAEVLKTASFHPFPVEGDQNCWSSLGRCSPTTDWGTSLCWARFFLKLTLHKTFVRFEVKLMQKMRQKEMLWKWWHIGTTCPGLVPISKKWSSAGNSFQPSVLSHYAKFPVKVHQVLWDLFVFLTWQEKDWFSCQSLFFWPPKNPNFPTSIPSFLRLARHMSFAQSLARKADEVEAKRKEAEMRMDAEEAARIRIWVPRLQEDKLDELLHVSYTSRFCGSVHFPSRFFSVSTIYRVQFRKVA